MTAPLRDPEFRKLWFGQAISEVGSRITREGLPLIAVLHLGASPTTMGYLAATGSIATLLFGLVAGVIADRVRRGPLMIGADLGRAMLLLLVPWLAARGQLRIEYLFAIAALTGVLTVLFDVAYQSYVPSLVEPDQILPANQVLSMTAAVAEVAGPSLTGILIQTLTAPRAILLDAISFVVSAAGVAWIQKPESKPVPQPHESMARELLGGMRFVFGDVYLSRLAIRYLVAGTAGGIFYALYVLYLVRELKLTPFWLGIVIACGGCGYFLGSAITRRLSAGAGLGATLIGSAVIIGMAALLVPAASFFPAFAIPLLMGHQLIGDSAAGVYLVQELSLRQKRAPDEVRGRVNATMQMFFRGTMPIGALAGGILADSIGMTNTLFLAGITMAASAVLLMGVPWRRI